MTVLLIKHLKEKLRAAPEPPPDSEEEALERRFTMLDFRPAEPSEHPAPVPTFAELDTSPRTRTPRKQRAKKGTENHEPSRPVAISPTCE